MRINKEQLDTIQTEIYRFDENAQIYLFGSRTDDKAKGGDIDLLIVSKEIDFADKIKISAQLFIKLGEQKIDLVLVADQTSAFAQVAIDGGILL